MAWQSSLAESSLSQTSLASAHASAHAEAGTAPAVVKGLPLRRWGREAAPAHQPLAKPVMSRIDEIDSEQVGALKRGKALQAPLKRNYPFVNLIRSSDTACFF
jgi:hypothetical protein